jgi:hypothetical protein
MGLRERPIDGAGDAKPADIHYKIPCWSLPCGATPMKRLPWGFVAGVSTSNDMQPPPPRLATK